MNGVDRMQAKKWVFVTLGIYMGILALIGTLTVIIDPLFLYHAPLNGFSYSSDSSVYRVGGIVKNLDYDTVIAGSSMTLNFNTREADELFSAHSVRVTLLGEGYKRVNDILKMAFDSNPDIKRVIWGIDSTGFISGPEWIGEQPYPEYLYDKNPLNDVEYIFNIEMFSQWTLPTIVRTIKRTENGINELFSDGFSTKGETGTEEVLAAYDRPGKEKKEISDKETREMFTICEQNLSQNVLQTVQDHPDVDFYLFIPPYSICWWDSLNQNGTDVLKRRIDLQQFAIEKMLAYENVKLFAFFNDYDLIGNLDYYVDATHYTEEVNSMMLRWMKEGKYQLTQDNYRGYIDDITEYYCNFDYDAMFIKN